MAAKKLASLPQPALYRRVREILDTARDGAARSINTAQVMASWLIGREIVEPEQLGHHRADYGAKGLLALSASLSRDYGCGYSVDNLEAFRQFYLAYPHLISVAVSRKSSGAPISETVSRKLTEPSAAAAWLRRARHPVSRRCGRVAARVARRCPRRSDNSRRVKDGDRGGCRLSVTAGALREAVAR